MAVGPDFLPEFPAISGIRIGVVEAGIKKAMLLEREACAMIVNGRWLKGLSYQGCADEIRARGEQ